MTLAVANLLLHINNRLISAAADLFSITGIYYFLLLPSSLLYYETLNFVYILFMRFSSVLCYYIILLSTHDYSGGDITVHFYVHLSCRLIYGFISLTINGFAFIFYTHLSKDIKFYFFSSPL